MTEASPTVCRAGTSRRASQLLADARNIDYEGPGGNVQIGGDGDPEQARFDVFEFDEAGRDVSHRPADHSLIPCRSVSGGPRRAPRRVGAT